MDGFDHALSTEGRSLKSCLRTQTVCVWETDWLLALAVPEGARIDRRRLRGVPLMGRST